MKADKKTVAFAFIYAIGDVSETADVKSILKRDTFYVNEKSAIGQASRLSD